MSTQLTTTKPSAMRLMADRCNVDPEKLHQTLKNTVFKGATDDEMLALVVTANVYELNPLLKELYAFPKKGGGITPMVGVDGWLKIANRQPNYDGMTVEVYGDGKEPTHATCEIFLKDRTHPVKITEYFEECVRQTDPWRQMPRRMLRNKVIIQTIRVAFGIGGIHDEDEAADIAGGEVRNVTPNTAEAPKVITGGNDTPAPAKAPAKAARTVKEAVEVPVEPVAEQAANEPPAVEMPPRATMIADLRVSYRASGVKTGPEAEEVIRKAGLLPVGVGIAGLTNDEKGNAALFAIWQKRDELFVAFPDAPETQTEGGTEA